MDMWCHCFKGFPVLLNIGRRTVTNTLGDNHSDTDMFLVFLESGDIKQYLFSSKGFVVANGQYPYIMAKVRGKALVEE